MATTPSTPPAALAINPRDPGSASGCTTPRRAGITRLSVPGYRGGPQLLVILP
jgi:hypothetical protein